LPTIIINGSVIDFPNSSASPDWSHSVISFAQLVADALAISVNAFDVSPQTYTLDSFNSASNVSIPTLSFPTSAVRSVFIHYSVYRTTSSANLDEAGDLIAIYNPNNSTGMKWTMTRGNMTSSTNGAQILFNMTDVGQLQFSTTPLAGSNHVGRIAFDARALPQ
jgi:hypothetical protein